MRVGDSIVVPLWTQELKVPSSTPGQALRCTPSHPNQAPRPHRPLAKKHTPPALKISPLTSIKPPPRISVMRVGDSIVVPLWTQELKVPSSTPGQALRCTPSHPNQAPRPHRPLAKNHTP